MKIFKEESNTEQDQNQNVELVGSNAVFFQLMEKVGAIGKYQYVTFILWCMMVYMAGGLTLMPSFLFFQDPYICDSSIVNCHDTVCLMDSQSRQQHTPQVPTIDSIANKFGDYRCQPESGELTLVITLMYAGALLGIFFMAVVGDIFGRKALIFGNLILITLGLLLTIFCTNLWMAGFGMFLCVFGGKNNFNLCLVYTAQTVNQKYRQIFTVVIQTFFCIGGLSNVLWYYAIRNFQSVLIYFYGLPALLLVLAMIFFVKDSPITLISKKTPEQAYNSLKFIAQVNQKSDLDLTIDQLSQIQHKYKEGLKEAHKSKKSKKNFSILDLFRYKSLRTMTLMLIIMDFTIDLEYYTPTLMLDQFHFSIFVNGLVIQSSQIFASIISSLLVYRIKRRIFGMISFAVVAMCSFVLIFIWDQDSQEETELGSNIAVLIFIFLVEFSITAEFNYFLVYINELFPTQVRIIGIGLVKTFGGTSQTLSALLISLCKATGFKIMIIFSALAALCVFCSYLLRQTFGKIPAEMIEQLQKDYDEPQDS